MRNYNDGMRIKCRIISIKRLFSKKYQLWTKATKQRIVLKDFGGVPVLRFLQKLALDFLYICL